MVIQFLLRGSERTRARHLFYKNMPRILISLGDAMKNV